MTHSVFKRRERKISPSHSLNFELQLTLSSLCLSEDDSEAFTLAPVADDVDSPDEDDVFGVDGISTVY